MDEDAPASAMERNASSSEGAQTLRSLRRRHPCAHVQDVRARAARAPADVRKDFRMGNAACDARPQAALFPLPRAGCRDHDGFSHASARSAEKSALANHAYKKRATGDEG